MYLAGQAAVNKAQKASRVAYVRGLDRRTICRVSPSGGMARSSRRPGLPPLTRRARAGWLAPELSVPKPLDAAVDPSLLRRQHNVP